VKEKKEKMTAPEGDSTDWQILTLSTCGGATSPIQQGKDSMTEKVCEFAERGGLTMNAIRNLPERELRDESKGNARIGTGEEKR